MKQRPTPPGFTLVEMLIVLVLLSLMALALASVVHTAGLTEQRVDARLQRIDDVRIASDFLRSVLERISAQKRTGITQVGDSRYFFQGQPAEIRWVGIMPARYGAGGRHHFRLFVADDQTLQLQYTPWIDAATAPDWAAAPSITLLADVTAIALQYEDASGEPPAWTPQWTVPDRLPDRLTLAVQTASGPLPELVTALRATAASAPGSGGIMTGPF